MAFKPQDYTSVSPYLIVSDAAQTIAFLQAALDAEALRNFPNAQGGIMHAELRIDDSIVMLGEAPDSVPPAGSINIHVYVPDVDTAYRRALDAGAASVQPPMEKGDGDRRGGVQGPDGTIWWLSTQVD